MVRVKQATARGYRTRAYVAERLNWPAPPKVKGPAPFGYLSKARNAA